MLTTKEWQGTTCESRAGTRVPGRGNGLIKRPEALRGHCGSTDIVEPLRKIRRAAGYEAEKVWGHQALQDLVQSGTGSKNTKIQTISPFLLHPQGTFSYSLFSSVK